MKLTRHDMSVILRQFPNIKLSYEKIYHKKVYNSNIKNAIHVKKAKLSGYTCIESDIIHDDFSGDVAKGDTIIFKEVGAYSVVMKPPFILPDVAIIQFNKITNCYDLIRVKQTFNDVFHNFKFLKND